MCFFSLIVFSPLLMRAISLFSAQDDARKLGAGGGRQCQLTQGGPRVGWRSWRESYQFFAAVQNQPRFYVWCGAGESRAVQLGIHRQSHHAAFLQEKAYLVERSGFGKRRLLCFACDSFGVFFRAVDMGSPRSSTMRFLEQGSVRGVVCAFASSPPWQPLELRRPPRC